MIISIRGTSGSGKSTIVRELIRSIGRRPIPSFGLAGELVGYDCGLFRVVGPYPDDARLAAGVDILNRDRRRRSELFGQIALWAGLGNVVYEGLLIANEVERTVALAQKHETICIFLNTPLELCLSRINARRLDKLHGGSFFEETFVPVNPKETTEKYEELRRVAQRLAAAVPVEHLDCAQALARCKELLL